MGAADRAQMRGEGALASRGGGRRSNPQGSGLGLGQHRRMALLPVFLPLEATCRSIRQATHSRNSTAWRGKARRRAHVSSCSAIFACCAKAWSSHFRNNRPSRWSVRRTCRRRRVRLRTSPQWLLLDITGPGGLDSSLPIRDVMPDVKIVALGVAEVEQVVMACAKAGVSGFVAPSGSVKDVVAAVHSAVRGELVAPPHGRHAPQPRQRARGAAARRGRQRR